MLAGLHKLAVLCSLLIKKACHGDLSFDEWRGYGHREEKCKYRQRLTGSCPAAVSCNLTTDDLPISDPSITFFLSFFLPKKRAI
jgi:hypothetical protein